MCSNRVPQMSVASTLTERVSSADESHSLAVVHAHAFEHIADLGDAAGGIGDTHRTFGVD